MGKGKLWIAGVGVIMLAACSDEEAEPAVPEELQAETVASPEPRAQQFVELWQAGEYETLYEEFLTESAKRAYGEETFIDWQQELDEQLALSNRQVDWDMASDEWPTEQPADFPFTVTTDSVVGEVTFDNTMSFVYEETEEQGEWFAEWDPSFILPNLSKGDNISVQISDTERGEIVDRNGSVVAGNTEAYEIGVVPGNFDRQNQTTRIAELLDMTPEEIDEELDKPWVQPHYYVPLATIHPDRDTLNRLFAIPGTKRTKVTLREYPYGESMAHLTGYVAPITAEQLEERSGQGYNPDAIVGREGLEAIFETELRGERGGKIFIEKTRENDTITAIDNSSAAGETVTLTIDADLQQQVYREMDGEPGTAAAVDPYSGETHVLVSSPSFNPNDFIPGIKDSVYRELADDPGEPFFNRSAATYPPSHIMQPLSAAVAIKQGTLDPGAGIDITGETWQKFPSWNDFRITRPNPGVSNPIDLEKAIVHSDSIYFAIQATNMPDDTFREGLNELGFGEAFDYPLPLSASQISESGEFGSEGQVASSANGEGQVRTNILHTALMYGAFLADGEMKKPILFPDAEQQTLKQELISAEQAELMRTILTEAGAQEGHGYAGKTATLPADGGDMGWFAGYDPIDGNLSAAVMMEDERHVRDVVDRLFGND
ncbi:penicillin-binding transpeptidase domain-containing protein [Planococcus sp. ISL-109]|uniref:penicillin-binding transpeptidase domain-containing protein n=1 Tax=Planococcus sp. ISL-109 TaxID=2819166 RepID=UPI001BEBE123|nr:penicillin-binding transpeptidase domain-containing protein [Planococcus sp. ISL-109]MBT2584232.1 penicillin-binding transpeptidase domain-containing protein [Planococcus sp. ISL-109]